MKYEHVDGYWVRQNFQGAYVTFRVKYVNDNTVTVGNNVYTGAEFEKAADTLGWQYSHVAE